MATITTYAGLQAAVARWLIRGDQSAIIPDFISLAEAHFNRVLRVRQMEARDTAPVSTEYGTVPDDWVETKTFSFSDGSVTWWLEPKPDEVIDEAWDRTGRPRFYANVGDSFRFYPAPDATYTAALTYFAEIPALSDANPSNWLLDIAPDAYLFGALTEAAPMLRDTDMAAMWLGRRDLALAEVRKATRTKAGKLRTEVGGFHRHRSSFNITQGY
jgi:hypothetical protein